MTAFETDSPALPTPPRRPTYLPVAPAAGIRRREVLRQALHLPRTLVTIWKQIREDYAIDVLDEHLWAFRGFFLETGEPQYRARRWQKTRLATIGPDDVLGMSPWELAFMVNVAREIEEPIFEYSRQNGEGFRLLLPSLARFLGKNVDEATFAAQHGLAWCESPWCAEERRHASSFGRIIERLTGLPPPHDNPNRPKVVTASENDAIRLISSREAAEWNSSSTYTVLAAHAAGSLHTLIRNVARDEIKHLAILGAARAYLFGHRPWSRFADLVRHSLHAFMTHRRGRSGGHLIGTNPISAMEVGVAHLFAEVRIRRWLASVPLRTLEFVFDGPSRLPDLPVAETAAADPPAPADRVAAGRERRATLSRWTARDRTCALEQRTFEDERASAIDAIVDKEFGGFVGAKQASGHGDRAVRRRLRGFRDRRLRAGLLNRLRDFQIRDAGRDGAAHAPYS